MRGRAIGIKFVFIMTICLFFIGCTQTQIKTVPASKNDEIFDNYFYKIAKKELNKFLESKHSQTLKTSEPYIIANRHLNNLKKHCKRLNISIPDRIELILIPSDKIFATSYPPRTIIYSRNLFEPNSPFYIGNKDVAFALFAHEIAHLMLKHSLKIAKAIKTYNEYRDLKTEQLVVSIVNLLPGVNNVYTITGKIPNAKLYKWYFEAVADFFALKILDFTGCEINRYIKYLEKLKRYNEKGFQIFKANTISLKIRIYCANEYALLDMKKLRNTKKNIVFVWTKNLFFYETGSASVVSKIRWVLHPEYMQKYKAYSKNKFYEYVQLAKNLLYWLCACESSEQWVSKFEELSVPYIIDDNYSLIFLGTRFGTQDIWFNTNVLEYSSF